MEEAVIVEAGRGQEMLPSSGSDLQSAINGVERAKSYVELKNSMKSLVGAYGLSDVAYAGLRFPGGADKDPLLLVTFDHAWVQRYTKRNYFRTDPAVKLGRTSFLPLDWDDMSSTTQTTRRFFGEAQEFGIGPRGVTFPIRGPNGDRALFSLTTNMKVQEWKRFRLHFMRDFQLIAYHVHRRSMTLSGYSRQSWALSRRQRECLQLLGRGRAPKQIAADLKLSESAVRLYISLSRHKLGCVNTNQTLVKAATLGLIEI